MLKGKPKKNMFKKDFITDILDDDVEMFPLLSIDEDDKSKIDISEEVSILPLKNTVLFPGVVIPITVGRDKSIQAIQEAYKGNKLIGVLAQKSADIEDPELTDLHEIGTVAKIIKKLKMPDGSTTVIIQGKKRFKVKKFLKEEPSIRASIKVLKDIEGEKDKEFKALMSSVKEMATKIIKLSPNIPSEASFVLKNIEHPYFLVNFIASNLNCPLDDKQKILEISNLKERAENVLGQMTNELEMLNLKNKIQSKVQTDIEKQQKDYFLNQQMKQIQEELGGDAHSQEIKNLKERAAKKKWSKEIADAFEKELEKLQRVNAAAADYSVIHNYLELLLDLPWNENTKDNFDLKHAQKVLDKDHHGLEKIKDRIIEYLAVLKLKGDMKSPIICLVGPPGVGKTSLGRSIANALGRQYVRMSLGGLHDEAEIRGHRKTYIGAMPGRVIQSIKKAKSSNPVMILDEIDKVGSDFRGDPSSALLEVLDPEQNTTFYDNFLELEYDLSKVLFVATANSMENIQPALRDRMEIIYLTGYSVEEKQNIAKKHLVRKQREAHGLKANQVKLNSDILKRIIEDYSRESGVRELERQIASVMRSIAKAIALEEKYNVTVTPEDLEKYLGPIKYDKDVYEKDTPPGVVVGLAWTQVGGDILFIEAILSEGKGKLTLTGNLGDVMKESASTALSYIKSNAKKLGIDPKMFETKDIHVHIPEGAIPKDGPSAGITMLTALTSAFTNKKIKPHLAMTGEITLRGKVLPVGGLKEKMLAAKRAGVKHVILCSKNKRDIDEINKAHIKGLKFHYVDTMSEVLDIAFSR